MVSASTDTWDPDNTGPTTGVPADDVGTWGNAASLWYNAAPGTTGGSDVVWPNDGVTVAQFGDPFGTVGVTGTAGTVNLGTNISAGGLILNNPAAGNYTINASADNISLGTSGLLVNGGSPTLSMGSGESLTNAGITTIGNANFSSTTLTVSGAGSFTATPTGTTGFTVGNGDTATLQMGGLANFSFTNSTAGAEFDVGINSAGNGTVTLANNSSITAAIVRVGDSEGTVVPGSGTLNLGSGSTVIDAGVINIGGGNITGEGSLNGPSGTPGSQISNGTVQFAGSSGTLTIGPLAGATGAQALGPFINIAVGGSGSTNVSGNLNLDGHSVSINAASLDMGQRTSGTANSASATLSFDTGTINVGSVYMSHINGSSSGGTGNSTINIGSSPTSTELFDVNGSTYKTNDYEFQFGAANTGTSGYTANATLNILGGTALINSNIFASAAGTNVTDATINLEGGTLNMNGNEIGGTGGAENNVAITFNATSGTLENVGEIDSNITASHGMTKSGSGTVTLLGTNTWGGTTTVSSGTLLAGAANSMSANAATNVTGGTLDVSGYANTVHSLTVGSGGTLNLGIGNLLTDSTTASLAGTLNVSGTPVGPTVELMSYASETGTFASVPTFAGYSLVYNSTQLDLIETSFNLTWDDAGGSGDGVTWNTTSQNWNNGSGPSTYTDGALVTFNDANNATSNGGTNPNAYNVTLNTTVSPSSVTVNNSAGNYTISGSGNIAGSATLTKTGTSTLTLSTANTYSGGTTIDSGAVVVNAGGTLGAAGGALVLGTPVPSVGGSTTATGNLTLNTNLSVGSFSSTTNNSTADILTISPGSTLTDTGAFNVGGLNNNTTAIIYDGALTATGGGSLAVSGTTNFNVGQTSNNTGGKDVTTVDFSGLNSVNINTTGTVGIGNGINSSGILTLADTTVASVAPSNFINANEIDVGNSQANNDGGMSTLSLGSGTNTLQANTINIGFGKTGGIITWVADATASSSVTIDGTGGGSAVANITLGQATAATYTNGRVAQLLLAGHSATVQAGTLLIADSAGNTINGPNSLVTFDTGTFNVQTVILGEDASGNSLTGPTGSLTIGGANPNNSATGVFTVGSVSTPGTFDLGDYTNNGVITTVNASFTINSGVANVYANIADASTEVVGGGTNSTLTLAGNGVLNMEGYSIGLVSTVQLAPNSTDTATLENLGGAGINGSGLTMNGSGTLTLLGTNTYSGGTIVNSGKLIVGASGALPTGTLAINNNGIARLADNITAGTPLGTSSVNLTSLSITGTGTLDIGNNRVIIDYTTGNDPIASIAAWIKNGFYDLSGPQIISSDIAADDAASGLSYGIGYADGADGAVAGLPSGEIEIMFTLLGDANLDGIVNSEDFTPFSANVGKNGSWDQGDFNYDGTVNSEDFTPFSADLGKSATLAAAAGTLERADGISLTNVPEPGCVGLLVLAGLGVLHKRRRREN